MKRCDALVVGGGPAGSTCARTLRLAGWNVVLIDRARFPRDKVCGGWLTPEVFPLLDLKPGEYRATGFTLQAITGFCTSVLGERAVETRYADVVSYAIRRCEFDHCLLRRADVCVREATALRTLARRGDAWIVNDEFQTPVVVGAGGHFCPVARYLQGERDSRRPVIAREAEFRVDPRRTSVASDTPELFFCRDLEGYGWCVRKGGYLNVGIGRRAHGDFADHVRDFIAFLTSTGRALEAPDVTWRGHAYHAMGAGIRPIVGPGVLLTGDAAGLAYPESGEGIKPAIESGLLAAQTLIAAKSRFGLDELLPYDRALRNAHPPARRTPAPLRPLAPPVGRALLHSAAFTRHFVLDRWFLRRAPAGHNPHPSPAVA